MDLSRFFASSLVDLGVKNTHFAGIKTPAVEIDEAKIGITSQFLDNAENYAEKYKATSYFTGLLRRGIMLSERAWLAPSILDIGTGAGSNSVFPALSLFPDAQIVATDLSPNLLAILMSELQKQALTSKVSVVAVDAMKDHFRPEAFDLVIGAAILHHLYDPANALRAAFRALKPGGAAIFFEPIEMGASLLALAFERILSESNFRPEKLDPLALHYMYMYCQSVKLCLGRDKISPAYENVDDKWLFSHEYFQEKGGEVGFSEVKCEAIFDASNLVERRTDALLRLVTGTGNEGLPIWAADTLRLFDNYFSESRSLISSESIIVLNK